MDVSAPRRQRVGRLGGRLASHDGRVVVEAPAGAFAADVDLTLAELTSRDALALEGHLCRPLRHLRLEVSHADGGRGQPRFGRALALHLQYAPADVRGAAAQDVLLYTRPSPAEPWRPIAAAQDRRRRVVSAELDHFSEFLLVARLDAPVLPTLDAYGDDLYWGAAAFSLPIELPPGTGGLTPRLTLTYSSTAAQAPISERHDTYERAQASWVGYGWTLSLGYVEMDGGSTSAERGRLVHEGRSYELIKIGAGAGWSEWRTQEETFVRIRRLVEGARDYFLIQQPDGTACRYGYNPLARHVVGSGAAATAFRYHLDRIEDSSGNRVDVTHVPNGGAVYPEHLDYSTSAPGGPHRRVWFVTDGRNDPPSVPLRETQKLRWIDIYVADPAFPAEPQQSYELGYQYFYSDGADGRTFLVLASVTRRGADGSVEPTLQLEYGSFAGWTYAGGDARTCAVPLLTRVTTGASGAIAYRYDVNVWGGNGGGQDAHAQHWTVADRTVADGVGGRFETFYTPLLGDGPSPGPLAAWTTSFTGDDYPVFRGFQRVQVDETPDPGRPPATRIHTFFRGLLPADEGQTRVYRSDGYTYPDVEQFKGHEVEVVHSQGASVLARDWTLYTHSPASHPPGGYPPPDLPAGDRRDWRIFVIFLTQSIRIWGDAPWSSPWTKVQLDYDIYGNPLNRYDYSGETGFPPVGGWFRKFQWSYATLDDGVDYIVDRLAQEVVLGPAGQSIEDTTCFLYDGATRRDQGLPAGGAARGLLTCVQRQIRVDGVDRSEDTRVEYDQFGNVARVSRYDALGYPDRPAFLTAADPRATTYSYDRLTQTFPEGVTDPAGQVESRLFDRLTGQVRQVVDPAGAVSTFTYDQLGRLTSAQGPLIGGAYRQELRVSYFSPGGPAGPLAGLRVDERCDAGGTPLWLTTCRFFDGFGRLVQEHADGEVDGQPRRVEVNRAYDGRGRPIRETVQHARDVPVGVYDAAGWSAWDRPTTSRRYDALDRVVAVVPPGQGSVETTYQGWQSRTVDLQGRVTVRRLDGFGRVTGVERHVGLSPGDAGYASAGYSYDARDRPRVVQRLDGSFVELQYDALGRRTILRDPDAGQWLYEYDALGNPSAEVDPTGRRTEYSYDRLDRLVGVWYPVTWAEDSYTPGRSRGSVYDLMELRAAVDANAAALNLPEHVPLGGWIDEAIPPGGTVPIRAAHLQELLHRISWLRDRTSLGLLPAQIGDFPITEQTPCRASHVVQLRAWLKEYEEALPRGAPQRARVVFGYDVLGRRTSMYDGSGRSAWSYDPGGRLTAQTRWIDGFAYRTDYAYDALDRLRTMTYPADDRGVRESLTYAYGAGGWLVGLTSSLGTALVAAARFNALGLPSLLRRGASPVQATATHTYWGVDSPTEGRPYGALRDLEVGGPAAGLLSRSHFFDPRGSLTFLNDRLGLDQGFAYDDLDRLTLASGAAGEEYRFDPLGALVYKNGAIRYGVAGHTGAAATCGSRAYAYDALGNQTGRVGPGEAYDFRYDAASRLLRAQRDGTTVCRLAYDGDGVRTKRVDGDGLVHYAGPHFERNLGTGEPGQPPVSTSYYHAPLGAAGERWIALRRGGELFWVETDHLGSPACLTDASFAVLARPTFTPYGERAPGLELPTDRAFAGYTWDASTQLYHCGARYYDPHLARFIQPDPVLATPLDPANLDRYAYCLNSPLSYTDRSGQVATPPPELRPPTVIVDPIPPRLEPGPRIFDTGGLARLGPLINIGFGQLTPIRITEVDRPNPDDWIRITVVERNVRPRVHIAGASFPPRGQIINRYAIFLGRRVYQQDIDWSRTDKNGRTGHERGRRGHAPVGYDGEPMALHHVLQDEPGPMAEASYTAHKRGDGLLHRLRPRGYGFRNDPNLHKQALAYTRKYWYWRWLTRHHP